MSTRITSSYKLIEIQIRAKGVLKHRKMKVFPINLANFSCLVLPSLHLKMRKRHKIVVALEGHQLTFQKKKSKFFVRRKTLLI